MPSLQAGIRCFVRIQPVPKPGIPREEHRYLNSKWSIWEYWNFEFRRLSLRDGWVEDEWNWDLYLVRDERRSTSDAISFAELLKEWDLEQATFVHSTESESPE